MLANAEHIQPGLVGKFDPLEQLFHGIHAAKRVALIGAIHGRSKTVNSYLYIHVYQKKFRPVRGVEG